MKKILLFIGMFLITLNVKALTFNVDLTNIEDKGNNGTIGQITNIDIPNKTIDAYFQDIGDEVNFDLTITNSGNRAGTLKSITVSSTSESIEYTNNLPEGGLSINGNDFNTVTITAKVKEGAVNGTSSSEITIKYNYDEGSCPEGEILSDDESMCLCPEGKVRNEQGVCIDPPKDKDPECEDDEIYNETKKICEKKVVPTPEKEKTTPIINPSNPKTMDNIILITLLFFVSGLGIYAVLFKRLNTNKKKVVVGVITGVTTLALSFTVLAGVFGLDNLLSAIVNPITKSKEVVVTVNEEIELIETWDGNCDLDVAELTPANIFQGGSGTENDPYQIKTAEQLSCFAKSVNNGTTYEGQYIKQIKNIKLNDKLNDNIASGTTTGLHVWTSAGDYRLDPAPYFAGTYDGDNYIISGLYITDDSVSQNQYGNYKGLFGYAVNATFKNMELSDVYMVTGGNYGYAGSLLGYGFKSLTLDNIKTYGSGSTTSYSAGVVSSFDGNREGGLTINNVENNIDLYVSGRGSGVIQDVRGIPASDEPLLVITNTKNNGNLSFSANNNDGHAAGILGALSGSSTTLIENTGNTGNFTFIDRAGSFIGGIMGYIENKKLIVNNSYNTGNFTNTGSTFNCGGYSGGLFGMVYSDEVIADNLYNSGNIDFKDERINFDEMNHYNRIGITPPSGIGGIFGRTNKLLTLTNSYNTGNISFYSIYIGGIIGEARGSDNTTITNCYNAGDMTTSSFTGGIVGYLRGTLNKSYNTGKITIFSGCDSGGLLAQGDRSKAEIINSYNEGDIFVTTYGSTNYQVGGICGMTCSVTNSYNRGNLDFRYQPKYIGGIVGADARVIKNVYNSGTITIENLAQSEYPSGSIQVSGIYGQISSVQNAYNLGNIDAYYNGGNNIGFSLSGVSQGPISNSVNTGNITLTMMESYPSSNSFYIGGIGIRDAVTNSFNAGTLTIDDSALGHSIYDEEYTSYGETYKHNIWIGEINSYILSSGSSNNKFNTDPNNKSYYCFSNCTQENLDTVGVYTTESTPSILSVINGDNAFNDELDEEGLPTLKAFNE